MRWVEKKSSVTSTLVRELQMNQIHFWTVSLGAAPESSNWLNAALTPNEICYANSCEKIRQREFATTRAALRLLLSKYLPFATALDWQLLVNEYGKPELAPGQSRIKLRFNVSHSQDKAVIAFGLTDELGVDIEKQQREGDLFEVATEYFAPKEFSELRTNPDFRKRFFEYWTLKEAFIKAVGKGLALPLERFSFDLRATSSAGRGHGPIRISIDRSLPVARTHWQFGLFRLEEAYQVAIAHRCTQKRMIQIVDKGDFSSCLNTLQAA